MGGPLAWWEEFFSEAVDARACQFFDVGSQDLHWDAELELEGIFNELLAQEAKKLRRGKAILIGEDIIMATGFVMATIVMDTGFVMDGIRQGQLRNGHGFRHGKGPLHTTGSVMT